MTVVATRDVPPQAAARASTRGGFAVVCLLFLASGACGLVYQQLWLRQLSLVFGVTVYAVATVLAAFFGGLALGSFLMGRWIARVSRPLRGYGIAEIGVGVIALLTTTELRLVERVYVAVAQAVPDATAALVAVRVVLSFAVLLVPATLLGATLPLISASSIVGGARASERIGVLYATNTAGAITGALVSGFWLIGSMGIGRSFQIAAAVNVLVGIAAVAGSSRWDRERADDDAAIVDCEPTEVRPSPRGDRLAAPARGVVLIAFGVSGFVSIALEVVWFRVLVLYVESDTYAFTIILAAVLAGIALGGYVASAVMHRWGARLVHLVVIEIAIAVAALTSFEFLSKSFTVNGRYGEPLEVFGHDIRFIIVAGVLTVFPTAFLLGVAFPIGLALWGADSPDGHDTAAAVGTFYAVNVACGIAGSLAAGFVLVPGMGSRATLILLCAVVLASALALVWVSSTPLRSRVMCAGAGVVAFVLASVAAVPDPYVAALTYRYPGERVLWQEEGAQTTVSIHELSDRSRVMYLNGLHQANSQPLMVAHHRLIGALPIAIHPDPRRALVVGLGGGVTAGAISDDPQIDVDVVELASEVVEGATWLAEVNGDVTNRPNVDVRVDDGRNFLLTTDDEYDVITSDLIEPQHAGAGKLWSTQYWELARDALAPGGIMVQWVPTDRGKDHQLIVRSFLRVFPYVTAWSSASILVGSNEPLQISAATFAQRLKEPRVADALASVSLGTIDELRGRYNGSRNGLETYAGPGPLLTDDRPQLEFWRSNSGADRDIPADVGAIRGDPADVFVH